MIAAEGLAMGPEQREKALTAALAQANHLVVDGAGEFRLAREALQRSGSMIGLLAGPV